MALSQTHGVTYIDAVFVTVCPQSSFRRHACMQALAPTRLDVRGPAPQGAQLQLYIGGGGGGCALQIFLVALAWHGGYGTAAAAHRPGGGACDLSRHPVWLRPPCPSSTTRTICRFAGGALVMIPARCTTGRDLLPVSPTTPGGPKGLPRCCSACDAQRGAQTKGPNTRTCCPQQPLLVRPAKQPSVPQGRERACPVLCR